MGNSQKLGQKSVSPLIETKNSRRKVAQFSAAQLALARPPVREQAMWRVARLALRAIEQCLQLGLAQLLEQARCLELQEVG